MIGGLQRTVYKWSAICYFIFHTFTQRSTYMVTEQDVLRVLPNDGFVRVYVEHAMKQTTSPLGYHLATALAILATTCPVDYGMMYAGMLRPNLYTLLVGRSGEDQKSTALNIGKRLLGKANSQLIGDYPGSAEGLIDSIGRQATQIIPMSEFGKFLSSAQRGYFEPIKTALTDLWDCEPIQRAKANGVVTRVEEPRLNVLAACSIPYLEKHTLSEDWTGGFMGRWLILYSRRERLDPDPTGDPTMESFLINELEIRASIAQAGRCMGLDSQAKELWNAWFHDLYNRKGLATNVQGVLSRVPTLARKIALIYAWDFGIATTGNPWYMGLDVLFPAIQVAELHLKGLLGLFERIADNPDARLRRQVLVAIETMGGCGTLGEIIRMVKLKKRVVNEALEGLMEERTVTRSLNLDNPVYTLSKSF